MELCQPNDCSSTACKKSVNFSSSNTQKKRRKRVRNLSSYKVYSKENAPNSVGIVPVRVFVPRSLTERNKGEKSRLSFNSNSPT